uniref:Uncharacterized protein n=1 Tax=viral metagenome TaxID=1070528 RepID=A0A6H1ZCX4_9ZZZZ
MEKIDFSYLTDKTTWTINPKEDKKTSWKDFRSIYYDWPDNKFNIDLYSKSLCCKKYLTNPDDWVLYCDIWSLKYFEELMNV